MFYIWFLLFLFISSTLQMLHFQLLVMLFCVFFSLQGRIIDRNVFIVFQNTVSLTEILLGRFCSCHWCLWQGCTSYFAYSREPDFSVFCFGDVRVQFWVSSSGWPWTLISTKISMTTDLFVCTWVAARDTVLRIICSLNRLLCCESWQKISWTVHTVGISS